MPELIELHTDRLFLRQWRDEDHAPFAAMNSDSRVMEFFPGLLSSSESDALATEIRARIARRGWGMWAVQIEGEAPFIGFVGLNVPEYTIPASPCVEIGWRLAAAYWGKGYASEAARGALRVAFETLDLPEVVAFTAVGNQRSRAVMERLGMHNSGENFEHPRVAPGHPLREHVLYRMPRERWLKLPAAEG
jgi:RimJ/RimL family protein N-acetyltransferase